MPTAKEILDYVKSGKAENSYWVTDKDGKFQGLAPVSSTKDWSQAALKGYEPVYKTSAGWSDVPEVGVSLNKKTGKIEVKAPQSYFNDESFKTVYNSNFLKTLSQAYRKDPNAKMVDPDDESKSYSVQELVDQYNEAIQEYARQRTARANLRQEIREQTGNDKLAAGLTEQDFIYMSSTGTGENDSDETLISIPKTEGINLLDRIRGLAGYDADFSQVSRGQLKEVYNVSKSSREDIVQLITALAAKSQELAAKENPTEEDITEYARIRALLTYVTQNEPEQGFWEQAGLYGLSAGQNTIVGIQNAIGQLMTMAEGVGNILNWLITPRAYNVTIDGQVVGQRVGLYENISDVPGYSEVLRQDYENTRQTNQQLNEELTYINRNAAAIGAIAQFGAEIGTDIFIGKMAGAAAENALTWLSNKALLGSLTGSLQEIANLPTAVIAGETVVDLSGLSGAATAILNVAQTSPTALLTGANLMLNVLHYAGQTQKVVEIVNSAVSAINTVGKISPYVNLMSQLIVDVSLHDSTIFRDLVEHADSKDLAQMLWTIGTDAAVFAGAAGIYWFANKFPATAAGRATNTKLSKAIISAESVVENTKENIKQVVLRDANYISKIKNVSKKQVGEANELIRRAKAAVLAAEGTEATEEAINNLVAVEGAFNEGKTNLKALERLMVDPEASPVLGPAYESAVAAEQDLAKAVAAAGIEVPRIPKDAKGVSVLRNVIPKELDIYRVAYYQRGQIENFHKVNEYYEPGMEKHLEQATELIEKYEAQFPAAVIKAAQDSIPKFIEAYTGLREWQISMGLITRQQVEEMNASPLYPNGYMRIQTQADYLKEQDNRIELVVNASKRQTALTTQKNQWGNMADDYQNPIAVLENEMKLSAEVQEARNKLNVAIDAKVAPYKVAVSAADYERATLVKKLKNKFKKDVKTAFKGLNKSLEQKGTVNDLIQNLVDKAMLKKQQKATTKAAEKVEQAKAKEYKVTAVDRKAYVDGLSDEDVASALVRQGGSDFTDITANDFNTMLGLPQKWGSSPNAPVYPGFDVEGMVWDFALGDEARKLSEVPGTWPEGTARDHLRAQGEDMAVLEMSPEDFIKHLEAGWPDQVPGGATQYIQDMMRDAWTSHMASRISQGAKYAVPLLVSGIKGLIYKQQGLASVLAAYKAGVKTVPVIVRYETEFKPEILSAGHKDVTETFSKFVTTQEAASPIDSSLPINVPDNQFTRKNPETRISVNAKTDAQWTAAREYSDASGHINKYLRKDKDFKASELEKWGGEEGVKKTIKELDSLFQHELTEDMYVFRRVRTSDKKGAFRKPEVGDIIFNAGFTSTSLKALDDTYFGRTGIVLKVPKGTPAVFFGGEVTEDYVLEHELLFPRDMEIKITGRIPFEQANLEFGESDYTLVGELVPKGASVPRSQAQLQDISVPPTYGKKIAKALQVEIAKTIASHSQLIGYGTTLKDDSGLQKLGDIISGLKLPEPAEDTLVGIKEETLTGWLKQQAKLEQTLDELHGLYQKGTDSGDKNFSVEFNGEERSLDDISLLIDAYESLLQTAKEHVSELSAGAIQVSYENYLAALPYDPNLPARLNRIALSGDTDYLNGEEVAKAVQEAKRNEAVTRAETLWQKEIDALAEVSDITKSEVRNIVGDIEDLITEYIYTGVLGSESARKTLDALVANEPDPDVAREYIILSELYDYRKKLGDDLRTLVKNRTAKQTRLYNEAAEKGKKVNISETTSKFLDLLESCLYDRRNRAMHALRDAGSDLVDEASVYKEINELAAQITGAKIEDNMVEYTNYEGKTEVIQVDPILADLVKYNATTTPKTWFQAFMSNKAFELSHRIFRFNTTTLNAGSFMNQAWRDSLNSYVGTGTLMPLSFTEQQIVDNFGERIAEDYRTTMPELYAQLEKRAKETGKSIEETVVRREMAIGEAYAGEITETAAMRFAEQGNAWDKTQSALEKGLRKVEHWAGGFREEYFRKSNYAKAYFSALQAGKSTADAVQWALRASRDATTDFVRATYHLQAFTSTIPYLRAGINGTKSFWRLLSLDPVGVGCRLIGGILIPLMAATISVMKDEETRKYYKTLKEYEKENVLIYQVNGELLQIPIPQEIGAFTSPLRHLIETLYDGNQHAFWELALHDFFNSMPLEFTAWQNIDGNVLASDPTLLDRIGLEGMELLSTFSPTIVKTIFEATFGIDPFTGKPIDKSYWVVDSEGNRQLMDSTTSEFAQWLGNATGGSPSVLATLIEDLFGKTSLELLDSFTSLAQFATSDGKEGSPFRLFEGVLSQMGGKLTVNEYNRTKNQWNQQINALYSKKEGLREGYIQYTEKINSATSAEQREKYIAQREDYIADFMNDVKTLAKNLVEVGGGEIDSYRIASLVSLVNWYEESNTGTDAYSRSLSDEQKQASKEAARRTIQKLGIKATDTSSMLGYTYRDNNGDIQVKFYTPLEILNAQSIYYTGQDIHTANIETMLRQAGLTMTKMYEGYRAATTKAEQQQAKADWNFQVVKALWPYVQKYGVQSVLSSQVIDLLEDYIFVDNPFKTKEYLITIFGGDQ